MQKPIDINIWKCGNVYGDKMAGNGTVEKSDSDRALSLAEVVKNSNIEDKDFETFLKISHTLAKNLDTHEFKDISKILEDLAGIFEGAYKFSKLLRVTDSVDDLMEKLWGGSK